MKEFRKTDLELFICEECGEEFTCRENLSKHLKYHNISIREYYDKWIKEENDGICKNCGKETKFISKKYKIYCSNKCYKKGQGKVISEKAKIKRLKIQETYKFQCLECREKFKTLTKLNNHIKKVHGKKEYYDKWVKKENEELCKICKESTNFTDRISGKYSGYEMCCSKECREKYRLIERSKTNMEKYGVRNVYQREDIKEKCRKTKLEKYGDENFTNMEKAKETCLKNYGVEWPLQNRDILEKNQKSAKKLKQFRNTSLWYQGSYELDFLEKYFNKYPDIERGPSIKYKFKEKNKIYHPDFYIPSLNLIVEIKSSWILNIDEEINKKKKATISSGFKYFMILDKKYSSKILE